VPTDPGSAAPVPPPAPVVEPAPVVAPVETPAPANNGRIFASPLARKLAKDAGITVEEIAGSGPRGRILRRDVDAASATKPVVEPPVVMQSPVSSL